MVTGDRRVNRIYDAPMAAFASKLTRRMALATLLALPVAAVMLYRKLPLAQGGAETRLREALDAMQMPFAPTRFELVQFSESRRSGQTRLEAVIRMRWSPGIRQRGFSAEASNPDQAVTELIETARATFSAVT